MCGYVWRMSVSAEIVGCRWCADLALKRCRYVTGCRPCREPEFPEYSSALPQLEVCPWCECAPSFSLSGNFNLKVPNLSLCCIA